MESLGKDGVQTGDDSQAPVGVAAGSDINVSSFEELIVDRSIISAAQGAWHTFISSASSREAAGEAIYAALFDSAPSLQSLFTTPRAVQAMRFMNGLASFVSALDEPPKLKMLVESLGFGHLHLDVTVPRVVIFRDAILDLLSVELGSRLIAPAKLGWKKLLEYVGGAIIFCKAHYAERINTLTTSWKMANHEDTSAEDAEGDVAQEDIVAVQKKDPLGKNNETHADGNEKADDGTGGSAAGNQLRSIPRNFVDMFRFNSAVMGMGNRMWMIEVLACFHNVVTNVANSSRLQEECDVLSLRINRLKESGINLSEFKSCMLASLRSLLPGSWNTAHEVAWSWLWENVERLIKHSPFFVRGNALERAYAKLLDGLEEDQKYELRANIYVLFFTSTPAGQDFFKQSNAYLHIIAEKVLEMALEFYRDPIKMIDDISALGLRHVGYAIPIEYFAPFVSACIEVLMQLKVDEVAIDSLKCSLGLVAKMLTRTITEGSTLVMKAINFNSKKMTLKSISCAPRGERASWMLVVQVGTQDISPLAWAIQSGAQEAATAMLQDLLTIRADRDKYYYGMDDLFMRHPDVVKMLLDDAPALLPPLLNGLIWRSRVNEGGYRRVNYYIKHLVVDAEGQPAMALPWIVATKDPKIVCHSVMVLLNDLVWGHVVYRMFLLGKLWLFFTILVFMASQNRDLAEVPEAIFACRCFVYCCSMGLLIYRHTKSTILSVQAGELMPFLCLKIPSYLREWQESCSLGVTVSLFAMFCLEPILQCWRKGEGDFDPSCKEGKGLEFPYSCCAFCAMFFYWILLVDLSVFSNRVASYVLICGQLTSELLLYLIALAVALLAFSSAISCLDQEDIEEFQGIPIGFLNLFDMSLHMYSKYEELKEEAVVLFCSYVFLVCVSIFLSNLLVAQLHSVYSSTFEDMVGFARLGRLQVIVDTLPRVSRNRWGRFMDAMEFDKRIEFNEGDVGVSGGMQVLEPASANPTTVDQIRRYGGSTSPSMQWPDEENGDEDDRFERLEKLVLNLSKRMNGGRRVDRHSVSAEGESGSGEVNGSDDHGGGNSEDVSGA